LFNFTSYNNYNIVAPKAIKEITMIPFFQGFGIGAGLIIAIGAQNAYVLSQGVKKQHRWIIPLICATCDAILILAGAAGVGALIVANPQISAYAGKGGAIFLFFYGTKSLLSAFKKASLDKEVKVQSSLKTAVATTLGLTLLNPHVYLDTIVLLGSISGQFEGINRYIFAIGACTSSFVWFFSLSIGGGLLEPLFRHPRSWRILDLSIWLIMWTLAYSIWPSID
jgi:L-lysine exporter family protein LysE/ArgO